MPRSPSDDADRPPPTRLAPLPPTSGASDPGAGSPSPSAAGGCPVAVGGAGLGVGRGDCGGGRPGGRSVPSAVAGTTARTAASPAGMGASRTGSSPAAVSPGLPGTRSADPRPIAIAFDNGSGDFHGCGIIRRGLGVPAGVRGEGLFANRSRRRPGPGDPPVQRGDERADQPRVAAEVTQPPGARSRMEVHPCLRLRVECDANHHVARAAGDVPPRKGLNDAFLLVPPAGMPARQVASNEVEGGIPYTREGDGIGAAHETPVGGVGRCSGGRRRKRALETTGEREFLAQPVPPGRPGSRNRCTPQRIILSWRAHDFHSTIRFHGIRQTSHRITA